MSSAFHPEHGCNSGVTSGPQGARTAVHQLAQLLGPGKQLTGNSERDPVMVHVERVRRGMTLAKTSLQAPAR